MKNKYARLKAMLIAGTFVLTGSTLTGCGSKNNEKNEIQATVTQESTMHFDIGEHIISVPIENDVRTGNFQYDYHPGYEPVGISLTAYGHLFNCFGGGTIIYTNVEEVECSSVLTDKNGSSLYLDFGTPIYNNENEYNSNNNTKEFDIGQHIISIPIQEDNRTDNFQYEYYEGYEVVGIATSAYGKPANYFGGGVILYKNIVPVKCLLKDNGYTEFGSPIEPQKEKTYK